MLVPDVKANNDLVFEHCQHKVIYLTSIKSIVGLVSSSQAIDALFFSPPDNPRFIISPMTVFPERIVTNGNDLNDY